mgnify:CR=1 FL=1
MGPDGAPTIPVPALTQSGPSHTLLERIDEAAVVQVYADGFNDLPLQEKTLIWHLSQAAIAGRDIFYDQRYAHNLEMRDVLEAIVTHAEQARRGHAREIQRYTKLFWINTGPHNNLTARKFVLRSTPAALAAAAHAAARAGAAFPLRAGRNASISCSRGSRRCSSIRIVDPDGDEQDTAARQGHPHRELEQPARRRDDGGPRGVRRSSTR